MPRSLPSQSVADRSPPQTIPDKPEGGKPGAKAQGNLDTTPGKSGPKSGNRPGTFSGRGDPRNGRGPQRGAANAGRPPSVIQALAREAWAQRVVKLTALIDDPEAHPRVVVAAMAELRNGSGLNRVEVTGGDGELLAPIAILPRKEFEP